MILIVYTPIPLPSATGHHRKRKSFHSFLSNYQKRLLHKSRQTLNTTRTVFNGYFLVFSQQIAHRATHGETTGLLLVVPTFGDIFELYFYSPLYQPLAISSSFIFPLVRRTLLTASLRISSNSSSVK